MTKEKPKRYLMPHSEPLSEWSFYILAFLIPLYKPAAALWSGVWLVSALWSAIRHRKFLRPTGSVYSVLLISVIVFYLAHVVGLFYSENLSAAKFDLEVKAALILFPLAFLFFFRVRKAMLPKILTAFTGGVVVYYLASLTNALYRISQGEGWFNLTYSDLSRHQHPSYITWYTAIALFWLLTEKESMHRLFAKWRWPVMITLILFIVTMSSKAGLVCGAVVLLLVFGRGIFTRNKNFVKEPVILSAIFISFFLLNPISKVRVTEAFDEMAKKPEEINLAKESGSSTMRAMVWKCAAELIQGNPGGVGTGDVKDELAKLYEKYGYVKPFEKKLNAHSQLLQSGVALGWAGMVLFLLPFFLMLWSVWKNFTWIPFVFLLLTGFNFLVESMLEVQAGVMAFSYFLFLFGKHE